MDAHARLIDKAKIVQGLAPITPANSVPDYVSLKNFSRCTVIINVDNGATVTGSAITLKQATAVAGTSEKALAFDKVFANTDTGAADTLTETAVSSNTFTTDNTNAKNLQYVIEIAASDLDVANNFDCLRVGAANGANMVCGITYILHGQRYGNAMAQAAITD